MKYRKIRAIISGGGTGGHIFPALSIAAKLKEMNPETEILFVGADGRMEMEKVPAAGYRIVGLPVAGLMRKLTLSNLALPFKVIKSISTAKRLIRAFNRRRRICQCSPAMGSRPHGNTDADPGAERFRRTDQQDIGKEGEKYMRGI